MLKITTNQTKYITHSIRISRAVCNLVIKYRNEEKPKKEKINIHNMEITKNGRVNFVLHIRLLRLSFINYPLFFKKIAFGDKTLPLKGLGRSILLDNSKSLPLDPSFIKEV
jgi:hypothetical protein